MKDIKFLGSATGEHEGDNNDVIFGSNKDIITTEGSPRIKQSIAKILLTRLASHQFFKGYGSALPSMIFSKIAAQNLEEDLRNAIMETLQYLVNLEPSDVPEETITQVNALEISPVTSGDITRFFIRLDLTLGSNEKIGIILGD